MLNLTNAATFAEFVSEVREGGACEIVTMPQYREPLNLRILQVVWDVLRRPRFGRRGKALDGARFL